MTNLAGLVLLCGSLLAGCFNTHQVRIPLPDNTAGLDCYSTCQAKGPKDGLLSCMSSCSGATTHSGACSESYSNAICEQKRELSTWKTVALIAGVVWASSVLVSSDDEEY